MWAGTLDWIDGVDITSGSVRIYEEMAAPTPGDEGDNGTIPEDPEPTVSAAESQYFPLPGDVNAGATPTVPVVLIPDEPTATPTAPGTSVPGNNENNAQIYLPIISNAE